MWHSISLDTDAVHADALSDALLAAGAMSVSVEDAQAGTVLETPQFGEPGSPTTPIWEQSRVVALFEPASDLDARIATAVQAAGLDLAVTPRHDTTVAEQDWVRLTQSQFDPIRISARLWIVPSWHVAPDPAAINLELDPGLAFGTGSHPTTRLCLEWLDAHITPGDTLLDYGCGSGILAIAAAKLGARAVDAVDIDPAAVRSTADNAARNSAVLRATLPDGASGSYPLVLANILATPLKLLAPLLGGHVAPGGWLVMAGILERQADDLRAAYRPHLAIEVLDSDEGWVLMGGQRSGSAGGARP